MHKHDNDPPRCSKCLRVVFLNECLVAFSDPAGGVDAYHLHCFLQNVAEIIKKYSAVKTKKGTEQINLPSMKNYHLCERCCRMMDVSKGNTFVRTEKGVTTYQHRECPPLKEKYKA